MENSLINFNKDEIRKYFNDYNKNLKDIKYNRVILNKNFNECILFIIKNLIEYFTNIINEMQNEIELNNYSLNNDNQNEDIFDFQITEKEINSIIFNLFNSKKYNIKIIDNIIINCQSSNNIIEDNKISNSTLNLNGEDIYNIVKEIYNYDFISINKSEYDLEIEKEKLKIADLTKKLLSFDLNLGVTESITDEETKILCNMIMEADEYILYFCSILNQYRSKTIYEMPLRVFDILSKIFQKALNKIEQSKNIEIAINIVTLSFSFFKIDDKKRCYIVDIIKNNNIFKSSEFWNNYISYQIDKDLERINTVKSIKEANENENKNFDAI